MDAAISGAPFASVSLFAVQLSFSSQRLAFLRGNLAVVCVETGFDEAPIRESLLIPAELLEHYEIGF